MHTLFQILVFTVFIDSIQSVMETQKWNDLERLSSVYHKHLTQRANITLQFITRIWSWYVAKLTVELLNTNIVFVNMN